MRGLGFWRAKSRPASTFTMLASPPSATLQASLSKMGAPDSSDDSSGAISEPSTPSKDIDEVHRELELLEHSVRGGKGRRIPAKTTNQTEETSVVPTFWEQRPWDKPADRLSEKESETLAKTIVKSAAQKHKHRRKHDTSDEDSDFKIDEEEISAPAPAQPVRMRTRSSGKVEDEEKPKAEISMRLRMSSKYFDTDEEYDITDEDY